MTQTSISRRRPCRSCGGRYFAGTMSVWAALIAVAAAIGGIAMTMGGGVFGSGSGPDPAEFLGNAAWLVGGFVIAMIVLIVGHGHRCIQCDAQQ